jgi:Zn-dependent protease
MRGSLTLGKILGIPIRLHSSWFLVAALITWSLAGGYFFQKYPGWATATYWIVGAMTAVLFFVSVLLHELSHSVVALREKVPVRDITLFIFGGVAQIGGEPRTAGAEFRIAIAGPLTSLVLAGLAGLLSLGVAEAAPLAASAAYLARINLTLALFNLIPGFPLDGGRVLRSLVWGLGGSFSTATRWASGIGRGVAYLLILMGVVQMLLGGGFLNGLWLVFIGWFLNNAAQASYRQVVLKDMLAGVSVRDVMSQQCVTVPGDLRLDRLVEDHVLGAGHRCFFVADNAAASLRAAALPRAAALLRGDLEGLLTLRDIKALPRDRRGELTTREVMTPVHKLFWARPDEDALAVLQKMDEANVEQVPVVDDDRLLGTISRQNVLHHIWLRSELGVWPRQRAAVQKLEGIA